MGRIRSIHPGQWTDEDFVECSFGARLLALGLRNEADDNGIFECKPVRLKMRLFPADEVDVGLLLDELEAGDQIRRFEVDGRTYGAIRNFRVFQNPRTPKAEHPLPAHIEGYVGQIGDTPAATAKRSPGRPRKQRNAETPPAEPKSFQQNAENNSLREGSGEESNKTLVDHALKPALAIVTANEPDEVEIAFASYCALRSEFVPNARRIGLDHGRRTSLAKRLTEIGGIAAWERVLATIRGSPFLRGDTSRNGFVPEIDWLLKPANLTKVIEGNYDNKPGRSATSPVDAMRTARALVGLN